MQSIKIFILLLFSILNLKYSGAKLYFGVGSSAIQSEGNLKINNNSESINLFGKRKTNANFENGTNSYFLWKKDIDLAGSIGMNMYRFSIPWTRILPWGNLSFVNEKEIQHYEEIVDYLLSKNIEPLITLLHFDFPKKYFNEINDTLEKDFTNYCLLIMKRFKTKVKYWITYNELDFILSGLQTLQKNISSGGNNYIVNKLKNHYKKSLNNSHKKIYEKAKEMNENFKIGTTVIFNPITSHFSENIDLMEYSDFLGLNVYFLKFHEKNKILHSFINSENNSLLVDFTPTLDDKLFIKLQNISDWTNKKIFITEFGTTSGEFTLNDLEKVNFIDYYIKQICEYENFIEGLILWSLLDYVEADPSRYFGFFSSQREEKLSAIYLKNLKNENLNYTKCFKDL